MTQKQGYAFNDSLNDSNDSRTQINKIIQIDLQDKVCKGTLQMRLTSSLNLD